jgi:urease accessory protein
MKKTFILLLASLLATAASAHPGALGHGHPDFLAGFLHPLTGADHLLAMLAVGMWSALAVRPAWAAPLAFVALLLLGALLGMAGVQAPAAEPVIAASVLTLGLLVAARRSLPLPAAALLAGGFALFHGLAHGAELPAGSLGALAGMVLATAALHLAGIAIGRGLLARHRWLAVASGSGITLAGVALLAQLA